MSRYARKLFQNLFVIPLLMGSGISVNLMAGPKYIPVVSGNFSTGQWYFEGEESSLGGNAGFTFVPALQYSNKFSLLPTIRTQYRGTRSAEELAGGTNLFQDTWESDVSIKAVHGLNKTWKLRERMGYRFKWFRETSNETWSKGLYDYRVINAGTEIEANWGKKFGAALGYDLSLVQFPNYVSLESSQPDDLAREFAGEDALDNIVHLLTFRSHTPFMWGIKNNYQVIFSPRYYTDQTVVERTGLLTSEKRKDNYWAASLSMEKGFRLSARTDMVSSLYYSYQGLKSNQNHYDARLTTFISDFFNYDQNGVGANLSFAVPAEKAGPMTIDLGYSYRQRNYRSRVTQSLSGSYNSEKLNVTETALDFVFGYPLTRNVRLRTAATFGRSKSNNDYEEVYRYNYDNANYQFGFTYEY